MSEEASGCLIMVVAVGAIVWFWDDIVSSFSEEFPDVIESVNEKMTDCDELRDEIRGTERCLGIPNCTLTKDEVLQNDKNVRNWFHYCSEEYGSP